MFIAIYIAIIALLWYDYFEVKKLKHNTYRADEQTVEAASNENFFLHNHEEYEIYMFLEGDSKYIVEGNFYTLNPGDMIIIRKQEMHRVFHNTPTLYRRFVLMISPEFFKQKNCPEYEAVFLSDFQKNGNKINADIVHSSGLYNAILRYKKYSDDYKIINTPITDSSITEILYILNKISSFSYADDTNTTIKEIIAYINNNFTSDISLDVLSNNFFISKYYLCRVFRKSTGLTVQNYIRQKRLGYARELHLAGKNLTEASMLAGFGDYSSFYRTYIKEYGSSPSSFI